MAKETTVVINCDICGAAGAESHSFFYDRRCDPAGSMENVYYDVDLCGVHFAELVRKHGHPREHRVRLVDRSKARAYGIAAKDWIELMVAIWAKMTPDERSLALAIETL